MNEQLNIGTLDDHHNDVFHMVHLLDKAIKSNSRESFKPIIDFLTSHAFDHFNEEEQLMRDHNFYDIQNHQKEHRQFKHKIKLIEKMYNENLHTTHIAYSIRQLIDALITHIQHVDVKMKAIDHE